MKRDGVRGKCSIVFDGAPGPVAGRFVEVEDEEGRSVKIGEWRERSDGFWALDLLEDVDFDEEVKRFIEWRLDVDCESLLSDFDLALGWFTGRGWSHEDALKAAEIVRDKHDGTP